MRNSHGAFFALLTASSISVAQEAQSCEADRDCPGALVCRAGACVGSGTPAPQAPGSPPSRPPAPPGAPAPVAGAEASVPSQAGGACENDAGCESGLTCQTRVCMRPDRSQSWDAVHSNRIGFHIFGDWFPANGSRDMSVFTGPRLIVTIIEIPWLRFAALLELGYTAVGPEPGDGASGLRFGVGAEVALRLLAAPSINPFVRLSVSTAPILFDDGHGLSASPLVRVSVGTHLIGVFDVHFLLGQNFGGGFSGGIGIGIGYYGRWEGT